MGAGGGLLFWLDQGGPELELTAEFPDKAVPVSISLGELGGMNGTPVFVPADENYYKVWVDVVRPGDPDGRLSGGPRTGARELWNSTYATEEVQGRAGGRPGGDIRNIREQNWPAARALKWGFGGGL